MNEFLSNLSVGERLERFLKVIGYDVSISDDALQVLLHDGLQFRNDEGRLLLVNLIANELVISCDNVRLRESKLKLAVKSSSVTYSADDDEPEILNEVTGEFATKQYQVVDDGYTDATIEVAQYKELVEGGNCITGYSADNCEKSNLVDVLESSDLNSNTTPDNKLKSVASNEPEIVKQSWGKRLYEFIFGL